MGILDEDVERVRNALPILEVIQPYVGSLRKTGHNWVGLCPFHAEKSGSFNVRESTGRYKCFGCQAAGDAISFIREIEHLDFVGAVERLATKAGIELRYDSGGENTERHARKGLIEAMESAVGWYHDRLLTAPDARAARDYLRARGISGDIARQFQIGWAPDGWDALAKGLGKPGDTLRECGLAFTNKSGRLQDSFRARLLFPIRNENGEAVAFGGRILPGSTDPAKYKNSSETKIYAKSRTLYGLSLAKTTIATSGRVVVCEGYTDVIGFHRVGVTQAVATCGTALTEEHVRLLKRFASKVVLAFDADAAGQGAAERFYEWERKHQVEVSVVHLPDGMDPGEMAQRDPDALRRAVDNAEPFLGFRVHRTLRSRTLTTPESRAKLAQEAMSVINEHPDVNVRSIYAGEVASHVGLPAIELVAIAKRGGGHVVAASNAIRNRRANRQESAEVVALALLVHRWDDMAPWLVPELFTDDVAGAAFQALGATGGDITAAIELADAEPRELLERIAVLDVDAEPEAEARNLIAATTRRCIDRLVKKGDMALMATIFEAKHRLELLDDPVTGTESADALLAWISQLPTEPQL